MLTLYLQQPAARGFELQSPPLAFLASILIFIGFSDLMSLSMPDEICLVFHWGIQGSITRWITIRKKLTV